MKRMLIVSVWGGMIVGWAIAGKRSDTEVLARVGEVVAQRSKASLPEASKVAGPFLAFRPGNALPIEERVRLRIHTDRSMDGVEVSVVSGSVPGEVRLRGIVPTAAHRDRACEIAAGTVGVEQVVNEMAIPER